MWNSFILSATAASSGVCGSNHQPSKVSPIYPPCSAWSASKIYSKTSCLWEWLIQQCKFCFEKRWQHIKPGTSLYTRTLLRHVQAGDGDWCAAMCYKGSWMAMSTSGGRIPSSYPPTISILGSLTVLQYFTLLPKFLKHTSAYALESSLHKATKCKSKWPFISL